MSVQLRTLAGTRTRKKPGNPSDKIPARLGSNPIQGRVWDGPLAPAGIPVPVPKIIGEERMEELSKDWDAIA